MLWIDWVLVGWYALGILLTVGAVGQHRKPITPGTAVCSVIVGVAILATFIAVHLS